MRPALFASTCILLFHLASPAIRGQIGVVLQREPVVGTVTTPDGIPVSGATVEFLRRGGEGFSSLDLALSRSHRVVAKLKTTKDGRFGTHVPRGLFYELRVTSPGFATAVRRWVYTGEDWKIVMEPPATLTGVVTLAGTGAPLADVRLRAWSNELGQLCDGRTDAEGRYRFENLRPGSFVMRLAGPRGASPMWKSFAIEAGATVREDLECPHGARLTGRVVDAATGEPIAGASIGEGWVLNKTVRSDAKGVYVMDGYGSEGYHDLHVHAPDYCRQVIAGVKGAGPLAANFSLHKGLTITGRVLDDRGRPARDVYVAAVNAALPVDWRADRTKADGSYEISGVARPLLHELIVRRDGYASVGYVIAGGMARTTVNGKVSIPDVQLRPARVLAGTICGADGQPVANVTLELHGSNADRADGLLKLADLPAANTGTLVDRYTARRKLVTNEFGHFRFGDLPAGKYQLLIGRQQDEYEVEVAPDKDPKPIRHQIGG